MSNRYDIALASDSEPDKLARADFLTGTSLNSSRGYLAVQEHHLPIRSILATDASWSYDLTKTVKAINMRDEFRSSPKVRKAFNRWESFAKSEMELDLALSQDVFSPIPIQTVIPNLSAEEDESLERATQLMSLEDLKMPPPMEFHFLKPLLNQYREDESSLGLPLAVNLLLSEWEVGSDPNLYKYTDPYKDTVEDQSKRIVGWSPQPLASSRPPVVATVGTVPPPVISSSIGRSVPMVGVVRSGSPARIRHSSPVGMSSYPTEQRGDPSPASSQQVLFTSTQLLPGKYGGRPAVPKKPKKRLGGF